MPTPGQFRLPRSARLLSVWGLSALAAALVGCTNPDATPITRPVTPSRLEQSVTPAVWEHVDGQGRFLLPQGDSSAVPELSGDSARRLAVAFWHDVGRSLTYGVTTDRGAPVHTPDLVACPRTYYAQSAYTAVPADTPPLIAKVIGSHWLVGMCYQGTEEVLISVSASAFDVHAGVHRGTLHTAGGDFFVMGVPVGAEIPVPPEEVAAAVAQASQHRLAAVPVLVGRPFPKDAVTAVWRVTLDEPISVTGNASGRTRTLGTFYAGALHGWQAISYAAANPSAASNETPQETQMFQGPHGPRIQYAVTRRGDVARALELINLGSR